jgi:hypothetical protein
MSLRESGLTMSRARDQKSAHDGPRPPPVLFVEAEHKVFLVVVEVRRPIKSQAAHTLRDGQRWGRLVVEAFTQKGERVTARSYFKTAVTAGCRAP